MANILSFRLQNHKCIPILAAHFDDFFFDHLAEFIAHLKPLQVWPAFLVIYGIRSENWEQKRYYLKQQ
jgi:hypothetical protein